jgi:hypothetical protein
MVLRMCELIQESPDSGDAAGVAASSVSPMAFRQLLAYRFGAESRFEGQLAGALERIESGGAMRVLDALFVAREPDSGQVTAISLAARGGGRGAGSSGAVGAMSDVLDFRLNPGGRAKSTRQALEGPSGDSVRLIGEGLSPGQAFAVVLVEHHWAAALEDAVARTGGTQAAGEFVEAGGLGEVGERLVELVRGGG